MTAEDQPPLPPRPPTAQTAADQTAADHAGNDPGQAPPPAAPAGGARLALSALVVLASAVAIVLASAQPLGGVESPPDEASESSSPTGTAGPSATAPLTTAAAASATADGGVAASCHIPDLGLGPYRRWQRLGTGAVLVPEPAPADHYDLLVHFHGAEAVRKLLGPAGLGLVIVGLDAGQGSQAYEEAMYGPGAWPELRAQVDDALSRDEGPPPELRHLIVSSWSAGYGAVRQLLLHHAAELGAVLLLDSLHASYTDEDGTLQSEGLEPFLDLARSAEQGRGRLWLTHSEIRPPSFASTSETATYLLAELGGQRRYAGLSAIAGVEHKTSYEQGALHVRGYTGTSRAAHCAHLRMLLPILRDEVMPALRSAGRDGGSR